MTQELLKTILHYNPINGEFTWLINANRCTKIGDIAGRTSRYIQIQYKYKKYSAHRLAWLYMFGKFPKNQIDHINRIKTDNRIINLRDVTCAENQKNKCYKITEQYYINHRESTNRWNLTISRTFNNGKRKHIGSYKTEEEAIAAKLDL